MFFRELKRKPLRANKFVLVWFVLVLFNVNTQLYANEGDKENKTEKELLEHIEILIVQDINEANKLIELAKNNETITNSTSLNSHLRNLIAFEAIIKRDLQTAALELQNAQMLASESGNKYQLAESLRRQGILMTLLGQYNQALTLLNEALSIHTQINSKQTLITLSTIINAYHRTGQNQKAKKTAYLLLESAEKANDPSNVVSAYNHLFSAYMNEKDLEQARFYVDKLLEPESLAVSLVPSYSYWHSARLEAALGNTEFALMQIRLAIQMVKDRNFLTILPELKLTEAEVLFSGGRTEEAIQSLLELVDEAEASNNNYAAIKMLKKLAEIFSEKEQFEQALRYTNRYQSIQDKVIRDNEQQLLALNQAKLDVSSKDLQIKTLEFEQDLNVQKQQYQTLIIAFITLGLFCLSAVFITVYRQKQKLKQTYFALEKASDAKSEFLARMSHEIRTPINAIIGLTKLSLKSSEDKAQIENLQQIEESSQTLLGVINDVLDFSKIEAGELYLSNIEFDLQDIIDRSLRLNSLKAFEKGIELTSEIARDIPATMIGDPLRLQQVLNNLISNAVKFTEEGEVKVFVSRRYKDESLSLQFEIRDTGIGINMANSSKLFESFSQADESVTRVYGGTGLGLAICKQLVELMKGTIWVKNQAQGGTSFFFTIKLYEAQSSPKFEITPNTLKSQRVLVIDDLAVSRESIVKTLAQLDIEVEQAEDGSAGITMFREAYKSNKPYDLIFIDWKMPNIDGIEVASVIRQESTSKPPNIVMMTNVDMQTLKSLGSTLGVNLYLEKPLSSEKLVNAILGQQKGQVKAPKTQEQQVSVPDFSQLCILLVDDNKLNRKVAQSYLADTNATIKVAEDGKEAIEALKADSNINAVLMDIQMPVMDGLTATQKIRQELKLTIPVIAMTAHAMQDEIERCIQAGMNAHVAKPIEPSLLYHAILGCTAEHLKREAVVHPESKQTQAIKSERLESDNKERFATLDELLFVDKKRAISILNNKIDIYDELIQDFIQIYADKMTTHTDNKEFSYGATLAFVHSFIPPLSYIGAYNLSDYALKLEQQLKLQNDTSNDSLIDINTEEKIARFTNALQELAQKLNTKIN